MCKCTNTSHDILDMVNAKRLKMGLGEVTYDWMMMNYRNRLRFIKPYRKIGPAYIWDRKAARTLVRILSVIPTTSKFCMNIAA